MPRGAAKPKSGLRAVGVAAIVGTSAFHVLVMPPLLRLLRPHQWMKNGFILVGIVFAHAWHDPRLWLDVGALFLAFCLMSSAVYIVNDWVDRVADREHPHKRLRPLAAGLVSPGTALWLAALLGSAALLLAGQVSSTALALLLAYVGLNAAYSGGLKRLAVVDVFLIAAGFMLRLLTGTLGLGITPSPWLLLCGWMGTLFLGFAKRRAELAAAGNQASQQRAVLGAYTLGFLDHMLAICAACAILSYSLYAMSETTVRLHGTDRLIYTIPVVAFGLFHYLHRVHLGKAGEDVARDVLRDPALAVALLLWGGITVWLIA